MIRVLKSLAHNDSLGLSQAEEPQNYKEALRFEDKEQWIAAMDREIQSLRENQTWDLVELPSGRKALTRRWIIRLSMVWMERF